MTNAKKHIGNGGEYVVFIQNMTHNGMNRAFIENGLNFQNIQPIEGILKNGIESDNRVNPTKKKYSWKMNIKKEMITIKQILISESKHLYLIL